MTKTVLVKWLEIKQEKALDAVQEKYEKWCLAFTDAACSDMGLIPIADKIEALLSEAHDVWNQWKAEHAYQHEKYGVEITDFYYHSSFIRQTQDYIAEKGASLACISKYMIKFENAETRLAHKNYLELRENIVKTYSNVVCAVRASKNAKEASAYLTELGFDLSELETAAVPVTALTVQINPQFLFLNDKHAA